MGVAVFYPMINIDQGGSEFHCTKLGGGADAGVHMYLDNIVVCKKHRRRGVARALMRAVWEESGRYGATCLTWQVPVYADVCCWPSELRCARSRRTTMLLLRSTAT